MGFFFGGGVFGCCRDLELWGVGRWGMRGGCVCLCGGICLGMGGGGGVVIVS